MAAAEPHSTWQPPSAPATVAFFDNDLAHAGSHQQSVQDLISGFAEPLSYRHGHCGQKAAGAGGWGGTDAAHGGALTPEQERARAIILFIKSPEMVLPESMYLFIFGRRL